MNLVTETLNIVYNKDGRKVKATVGLIMVFISRFLCRFPQSSTEPHPSKIFSHCQPISISARQVALGSATLTMTRHLQFPDVISYVTECYSVGASPRLLDRGTLTFVTTFVSMCCNVW